MGKSIDITGNQLRSNAAKSRMRAEKAAMDLERARSAPDAATRRGQAEINRSKKRVQKTLVDSASAERPHLNHTTPPAEIESAKGDRRL